MSIFGSPALLPFQVRSFRLQWPADLLTSLAFEMEALILAWYILVTTGSVVMLTVLGALQFLGTLIAPMMGVLGDRIGHRTLMIGLRIIYGTLATILASLIFAGLTSPTVVLVIAALAGLVRPSDQGIRAALIGDTMPPERMIPALAISRTTADIARIAGAIAGASLFATLGMGIAFLAVVACYVVGALLTFGVSQRPPSTADGVAAGLQRNSAWRELSEGFAYVRSTPSLLAAAWIAFITNLTAFPICNALLPYVARDIYHTDQVGLGYLVAGFASGALLGSIVLSLASGRVHPARLMIIFGLLWYAVLLAFPHMRSEVGGVIVLFIAGFMQSLCLVSVSIVLVRMSLDKYRGRVMGVRMLAINAMPIGLIVAGALVERIGFGVTSTLYAVIGIVFTLVIGFRWRAEVWRPQAPANMR